MVICNWRDSGHPSAGGAELYCEAIADEFHAQGVNVTYLTARGAGQDKGGPTRFGRTVRRGGRFTVYPSALWWLRRNRRDIDGIVDSQNGIPFFSPLAARAGTPIVQLIHHVHQDQFAVHFPRPVARLGQFLENHAARWVYRSRAVAAVSPSSRSQIRRRLSLRGPVHLTPCGQQTPQVVHRAPAARPRIVCVGRLVSQKRIDVLLRAMPAIVASVPGVELHLVGTGEAADELQDLAAQLGLDDVVVFHGWVDEQTRDDLVASAWLTATASMAEGWGLAVMEAAAAGVPAVALSVPGLRDTIRPGETGWLVEGGDDLPAVMAGAVIRALHTLADPDTAAEWSRRCVDWAEQFTWQASADYLLAILRTEEQRLARRGREHREGSDSVAVGFLPADVAATANLTALRITDRVITGPDTVAVLLYGADEHDAAAILADLGVSFDDPRVEVRLARQRDLLGWPTAAAPLGIAVGAA